MVNSASLRGVNSTGQRRVDPDLPNGRIVSRTMHRTPDRGRMNDCRNKTG
jgi:hypothetical protein